MVLCHSNSFVDLETCKIPHFLKTGQRPCIYFSTMIFYITEDSSGRTNVLHALLLFMHFTVTSCSYTMKLVKKTANMNFEVDSFAAFLYIGH